MNESRLLQLRVAGFKRLEVLEVNLPKCGVFMFCGKNGQGKSSGFDALLYALRGPSACPPRPIRDGHQQTEVDLDITTHTIRRTLTADGKHALAVTPRDGGKKISSPQTFLDSLNGPVGYDPLNFYHQKPADQARTLRTIAGLDTSDLDCERDKVFAERTDLNRKQKALESAAEKLPFHSDAPAEPVSVAALAAQHSEALATINANRQLRREAEESAATWKRAEDKVTRLRAELAAAEKLAAEWKADVSETGRLAEGLVDPDETAIRTQIQNAESINAKVRQNADRAGFQKDAAAHATEAKRRSARLQEIDREAAKRLADAKFPIPGLSVQGDQPVYQGVPLEQASSAERYRVSLGIGAALNPALRLALVYNGSLLDDDMLAVINAWAIEQDVLVLMERVGDLEAGFDGVLIVDGKQAESAVA